MSQLEVNSIDKYSGNNLSVGSQLNLKSYTTTARNALTSVAGDTIYNTTDNKVQVYNGSSWDDLGGPAIFDVDFLVVAGGAAGGNCYGAGGGAGGLRSSVGNTGGGGSLESALSIVAGKPYLITVGGGGTVKFEVVTSANANLSSPTVIGSSDAITANSTLTLGKNVVVRINPDMGGLGKRYLGARYVVSGTVNTGKVTADVVETIGDGQKSYASGFTVA